MDNSNKNQILSLVKINWADAKDLKTLNGIVYRIVNLINGKSYIGKAEETFNRRYSKGEWWKQTHALQLKRAIEKYNKDNFKIQILERNILNKEYLIILEEYYILLYNSHRDNGYNSITLGSINYKIYRKQLILKNYITNEIIPINGLQKFCSQNGYISDLIYRLERGEILYHKDLCLPQTSIEEVKKRQKLGFARNVKTIMLKNPEDQIIEIKNVFKFCENNNLSYSGINLLTSGKIKQHRGWLLPETDRNSITDKHNKSHFVLSDKNNNEIIIRNLKKFCKNNNLSIKLMQKLIKGEIYSYDKFINPIGDKNGKTRKGNRKTYRLQYKEKIYEFESISTFAEQQHKNEDKLRKVINKIIPEYHGWSLPLKFE